jgi:hypothetical protein
MFEDMVVSSAHPTKTNKPWTVILSMVFQVVFLGVLILIPLIYTEALMPSCVFLMTIFSSIYGAGQDDGVITCQCLSI